VDGATFDLFGRSAREAGNRTFVQVFAAMSCFVPQLLYPKTFDCSGAAQALEGSGVSAPALGSYFGRVVRYCVQTSWGKRPASSEPAVPDGAPKPVPR